MKNILLLMMGGSGTRFGAEIPKQYIEINGIPIFAYILRKYSKLDFIDHIVVISREDWIDFVEEWIDKLDIKKVHKVVAGGDSRSESILNGLNAAKPLADDEDILLIHDATHPYVDVKGSLEVIDAVKKYGGATLGQFQYDTLGSKGENDFLTGIVPRREIVSCASPEAFHFGQLYDIYKNTPKEEFEKMTSAGAIAIANNIPMKVIESNVVNLKITYKNDMEIFEKTADSYFFPEE